MTNVANVRFYRGPMVNTIYVGRPSIWGNPFYLANAKDRLQVLEKYKTYIYHPDRKDLRNRARRELKGRVLLCFCAPKSCHADILAAIADSPFEE